MGAPTTNRQTDVDSELTAVIMAAGKGSRMTELTARRPKCLLPIGNLPMIYFPLALLERSGFHETFVIVQESHKIDVTNSLEKCGLKIRFEIVGIPGDEDWGTADSLRFLQESGKIKTDVLIISSDLITDLKLDQLIDLYRKREASICALFVSPSSTNSAAFNTPGPKSKNKIERDLVGIEPETSRLVLLASASDFEETLTLKGNLMKKHGKISIHSKLLDTHVYIVRRWLLQYLAYNKDLSTLKGELLPYVVKKQLKINKTPKKVEDKASVVGGSIKTELFQFAQEDELAVKIRQISSHSSGKFDSQLFPGDGQSIRCFAEVVRDSEFTARANTLQQYWAANRMVLKYWPPLTNNREMLNVSPLANVSSTQLDNESCVVAENATISEKTSLKGSFIGAGASVSPKTLVVDSILMGAVRIGSGCKINNCIVCDEAVIEDGTELKDCIVGSQHVVPSKSIHNNEVLTVIDRLMEF
ncbi:eIF2B-gamma protein [Nesidiocoris tenuis]|uniref:Translation initiation factor eIF2B subunit gamma n=2 Tax=Nesidiocoris tenuis TaxID=355587 RepID=A0ABN7A5S9_9HEMI|nr:eIF2B-gamma protein [Nesidiocoris tenuis]